jgi:hypothetical protein
MKSLLSPPLAAALLIAGFAALGAAQTPAPDDRNAELLKKVEDLEKSLSAVKAELAQRGLMAAAPVSPAATPAPAPESGSTAAQLASGISQNDSHTLGPLQFRGYSDFGIGRPLFEKLPPGGLTGTTQSFTLGDFDLFVTARLNDHLTMLGEALITSDFTNEFAAEMDRLMMTYSVNKYLSVSAGKYNTAIGFYTNEFHRARYFQTTTSRPFLFADEDNGGILPVHSIGLSATGAVPSGTVGLHWVAEIANGRGSRDAGTVPLQNFVDENNGKAFNVALYARPQWAQGLNVGVSFYRDRLHPAGLASIEQRIYSSHAAFIRPHVELIGEGVLLQHNPYGTSHNFNTVSGYGQASYLIHQIRPYFRYEYQNIPASDPIFGAIGRLNGPSAGIRYDFSDFASFKVQYGRLATRSGPSTNAVQAQIAYAF